MDAAGLMERAKNRECAVARERAELLECTDTLERPARGESTEAPERPFRYRAMDQEFRGDWRQVVRDLAKESLPR